VVGQTYSEDFPTAWPVQGEFGGASDAFVTRLTPDGEVDFSTFFGGSGHEQWGTIDVVGDGVTAFAGETGSTDLPTTPGAFQTDPAGDWDAYLAVLDIDDTTPVPYPTGSPDPTPTPDDSPSPTESASPSPSGSPSPEPGETPPAPVTIEADVDLVVFGQSFHLSGEVNIPPPCSEASEVQILKRILGTETFKPVGTALTEERTWQMELTPLNTASYKAVVEATESCPGYSSRLVEVQVQAAIEIEQADACVRAKSFKGQVRPKFEGTKVLLQKRRRGDWVIVDRSRLSESSRFVLTRESCRAEHRVVWRSPSKLVAGATRRL
jgi:hypothetical protein